MKPAIKYSIPFNGDLSLMEDVLKMDRDLKKEINYIDSLIKRYPNFFAITLADSYQIKFFKNKFPDLEIEASVDFVQTVTNCDKTNCKKCKYCEKIGNKVIKNIN